MKLTSLFNFVNYFLLSAVRACVWLPDYPGRMLYFFILVNYAHIQSTRNSIYMNPPYDSNSTKPFNIGSRAYTLSKWHLNHRVSHRSFWGNIKVLYKRYYFTTEVIVVKIDSYLKMSDDSRDELEITWLKYSRVYIGQFREY